MQEKIEIDFEKADVWVVAYIVLEAYFVARDSGANVNFGAINKDSNFEYI